MFGAGQADFENAESLSQRFTLTHSESARAAPRPGWASGPGPELATPSVTGGIGSSKAANGEGSHLNSRSVSPAYVVLSAAKTLAHPTHRPNELWQTDFTYLQVVGWGRKLPGQVDTA